jgi:ubiquinone/menaquinone biosynthesis C-methylase UbiE
VAQPPTTEETASFYSRVAPGYAEEGPPYFAHAGRRLVELTQVRPGDVVLDLGTGRGAVLLPAARHVGPTGRAIGIDIATGMLAHTRRTLEMEQLRHASVRLMDVSALEFEPAQFTHVLSSFSVFFFADLPSVLRKLRQLLRPNGVVGFAFSRSTDHRWRWYEQLLRDSGMLAGLPGPTGYPQIREPGILRALLEQASFTEVLEREEPTDIWYASPEAWWASLWTHGSRRPLERMAPELLARIQTEALQRARELAEREGVPERMQLVYVLARSGEGGDR